MEYIIHTQVQFGNRVEVSDPYLANYPPSVATLRLTYGSVRSVETQLGIEEVRYLITALSAFLTGQS